MSGGPDDKREILAASSARGAPGRHQRCRDRARRRHRHGAGNHHHRRHRLDRLRAQSARAGRARAGGWGYIFGDEGGGFDIARQALRAALRMEEGWGPPTALREMLLAATGVRGRQRDAAPLLHRRMAALARGDAGPPGGCGRAAIGRRRSGDPARRGAAAGDAGRSGPRASCGQPGRCVGGRLHRRRLRERASCWRPSGRWWSCTRACAAARRAAVRRRARYARLTAARGWNWEWRAACEARESAGLRSARGRVLLLIAVFKILDTALVALGDVR